MNSIEKEENKQNNLKNEKREQFIDNQESPLNSNHKIKRNLNDGLFRMIFDNPNDKKYALSLYNALNNTSYDNPNDVKINTLKDAIYIKIKNDVSFIIDGHLALWEQQSTYNPNMPLRGLMYYTALISEKIVDDNLNIYGQPAVQIDTPQYIVFYNGKKQIKEVEELHLSSLFKHQVKSGIYDFTCKVYNLNEGNNKLLLDKCEPLKAYTTIVNSYRHNVNKGYDREEAVELAIKECVDNNLLVDFFFKESASVKSVFLNELSYEDMVKYLGEDFKQEGIKEGINEKQQEIIKLVVDTYQKGNMNIDGACAVTGLQQEEFLKYLNK